jgi:regulator of protease activity HflC (stomatin/prohibitin superfamily)
MISWLRLGLLLVSSAVFNSGCVGCTNIEPGHVGVLVKRCKGGGVEPQPLSVGWQFRNIVCEEIVEYPIYQQTLVLCKSSTEGQPIDDSINVTSNEGLPISIDCALNFTVESGKVPAIYSKFRASLERITHSYIKQTVREALQETCSKYTAEQLYSTKRGDARNEVQKFLMDKLGPDGFDITQFTVNEIRVDPQVVNAIKAKVSMVQEAQRSDQEVKKTEAEARQKVAKARGEAEAKKLAADAEAYYNKTVASSITPQLVQMQQVQSQLRAIEKWNGVLPTMTGSAVPFIQAPK